MTEGETTCDIRKGLGGYEITQTSADAAVIIRDDEILEARLIDHAATGLVADIALDTDDDPVIDLVIISCMQTHEGLRHVAGLEVGREIARLRCHGVVDAHLRGQRSHLHTCIEAGPRVHRYRSDWRLG